MFRPKSYFWRLRTRDRVVLFIAIILMLGLFALALWQAWPVVSLVSSAHAAEQIVSPTALMDFKAIVNLAIMGFVLLAGTVTVYTIFFSDVPSRVETANDYLKMILGFLLGCAKSFLGA